MSIGIILEFGLPYDQLKSFFDPNKLLFLNFCTRVELLKFSTNYGDFLVTFMIGTKSPELLYRWDKVPRAFVMMLHMFNKLAKPLFDYHLI